MVTLPDSIVAGETFRFQADGFSDASALVLKMGGPEPRIVNAALDASGLWTAAANTGDWKPGEYDLALWVTDADGNTSVEARRRLSVEADPSAQSSYDPTTDYEAIVNKIDAALKGDTADPTWQSYTISTPQGSRSLARMSIPDLLKLRSYYMSYVVWQRRRDKGLNVNGPRIVVRI